MTETPEPRYQVLARKYRPETFADLVGQEAMVRTLKNAFAADRIAQAFIMTGIRGTGKTTTARIIAKGINCIGPDGSGGPTTEPCGRCEHCVAIMEGRHVDVMEMDAASRTGVGDIREIIDSVHYRAASARYKIYIIDEVHMLSTNAFNALLKTLEEPPAHVKFIFATTEIRKVPVTVLSRCQRFDLRRVDVPELKDHFARIVAEEGAKAADSALALIARAAGGSVRDGLSILDQAIAMGQGDVSEDAVRAMLSLADRGRLFDLLELVFGGDAGAALSAFGGLMRDGADAAQLMADLAEAVHIATRIKAVGSDAGTEGLSAEERRRAGTLAGKLSVPLLSRAWQMLLKGFEEVSRAPNPAAAAEMVLIRICYTADLPSPDEIIRTLGGSVAPVRRGAVRDGAPATASATASAASAPARAAGGPREPTAVAIYQAGGDDEFDSDADADDDPAARFGDDTGPQGEGDYFADGLTPPAGPAPGLADPASFAAVVALAQQHREARLVVHLEDHVSLVRFDRVAGAIDLFLLDGAPKELANELREKLNRWTGRRWVVMLSKSMGETPLGDVKRARLAAEIEQLKSHPAVKAVLDAFPEARIDEVRAIARGELGEDDSATG